MIAATMAWAPVAAAATYAKGPYLITPNDPEGMTVLLQAGAAATVCTIEWGTTAAYGNGPVAMPVLNAGAFQHRIRLRSLGPDTRYFYRVNLDGNLQPGTFRTAPPPEAARITFFAAGDSRSDPADLTAVANAMLNEVDGEVARRETLWIHSGDWSNADAESNWTGEWFNRAARLMEVQRRLPVMGCEGNHEGSAGMLQKYYPYASSMSLPAGQSNLGFSFDYGPAHFAVLSSSTTSWLAADLQTSSKPWKFLVFHEPAWGAGPHGNDAGYQNLAASLNALPGVHVDMCLSGHNHNYVRAEVSGTCGKTYYMTAGAAGAPLYEVNLAALNVKAASSAQNFLRVDLDGNTLTGKAVDKDGAILDTFSLTKIMGVNLPDDNANGMPDAWEISHFGSLTNPLGTADSDWDHDGQNNLDEYLAGTGPTDPSSVFKIISATRTPGGGLLLQWLGMTGRRYAIQASDDRPEAFQDTTDAPLAGNGGILTQALPVGPATRRFYRVRVLP